MEHMKREGKRREPAVMKIPDDSLKQGIERIRQVLASINDRLKKVTRKAESRRPKRSVM